MCASVLILGLLRVRVFNSDPMLALAVRLFFGLGWRFMVLGPRRANLFTPSAAPRVLM